jgi:hypothetical protein
MHEALAVSIIYIFLALLGAEVYVRTYHLNTSQLIYKSLLLTIVEMCVLVR